MNAYEQKVTARLERLRARAKARRSEGEALVANADKMAAIIPMGQPILVGHHSEGRDRNYRARIDKKFTKGFATLEEARDLERRASAAESNTAISSDDPDAIEKLKAKLDEAERQHAAMTTVNKRLRQGASHADVAPLLDWWKDPVSKLAMWASLGHKTLPLGNSSAETRRIRERIAALENAALTPARETEIIGAARIEEGENRVRIFFSEKPPSEARALLKTHGFRWAPSVGAWQRHASATAWTAAQQIARKLTLADGPGGT